MVSSKEGSMKYVCQVCGYVYDEEAEGVPFAELPDSWTCPMCKAPKSMFAPEESEERNVAAMQPASIDADMLQLSPGALAALFSNLARGAEKQYMEKEPVLFRRISEYFAAAVPCISDADINMLRAISAEDIDNAYPQAKAIASSKGDRGALRACTWGEKVERILQALLDRYRSEGESFLENTEVWVCSICGFVYIGDNPPSICPVCKVPDWKFEKVV